MGQGTSGARGKSVPSIRFCCEPSTALESKRLLKKKVIWGWHSLDFNVLVSDAG